MAWRCRFLTARPSQQAALSLRNDLVKNYQVHPTHWLISTQIDALFLVERVELAHELRYLSEAHALLLEGLGVPREMRGHEHQALARISPSQDAHQRRAVVVVVGHGLVCVQGPVPLPEPVWNYAIEQTRVWGQRRVDGVGRQKFDFHAARNPRQHPSGADARGRLCHTDP